MFPILVAASIHYTTVVAMFSPTLLPFGPKTQITKEAYDQLDTGMSLTAVEKILGGPAGDYGPGKGEIIDSGFSTSIGDAVRHDPKVERRRWLAGDFGVTVCFDEDGRVKGMGTENVYRPYDMLTQLVYQKLGIIKKKPYPAGSINELRSLLGLSDR